MNRAREAADASTAQALPLRLITLGQMAPLGSWQNSLPHSRPQHIFLWITRGQGRATIRGLRRGIGTNNVVYLPAGSQFALETGPQCFGQVILIADGHFPMLPTSSFHLRIRDVVSQGELSSIVEMIQREQQTARPFQEDALAAQFNLAAVWLRRQILAMHDAGDRISPALPGKQTAGQRLSRRFADLLEQDFRSGLPMAGYAKALGVTPTHLTRVCRQHSGLNAADLMARRVLHEARHLLATTEQSVKNVARHLGFRSAAYFTRFIQNHTGQTPSAIRRAAQPEKARAARSDGPVAVFRHLAGD